MGIINISNLGLVKLETDLELAVASLLARFTRDLDLDILELVVVVIL